MGEFPRRTFCALVAASAGTLAGGEFMRGDSTSDASATLDRQSGTGDVTVVTTRKELEAAFENLSTGDTIRITDENAPYRTTRWLDIDVDGVTVLGPGVQTLVQPADDANVGGIRIGHNRRCNEIDIRGVGYHGNPDGQGRNAERLHGVSIESATNVTIGRCQIRGTYPITHGDGGSGISVTRNCSDVRIFNNEIHEYGDRGIQLASERTMVFGNVITTGLDRAIACDLWYSDIENRTAQSVSVFGNLLGDSVEGSLVGIARNAPLGSNKGYVSIYGNVGFGSHKSFCHVRGPEALQNISVQNNVSLQKARGLQTERTKKFAGIAVDVKEGRNLTVKNNELYDYSGHGIHVDSEISDMAIQQNDITGSGLAGIRIVDAANGLVSDNHVSKTGKVGVRLKGVSDTVVRGNYVRRAGTAGIVVDGSKSETGNEIADNYVADDNRNSSKAVPAILIRDDGVRVRGNSIRRNTTAAIAESKNASGNVFEGNRADGSDPWRFTSPSSRVRNNVPPVDVHRNVSAGSGSREVTVEFDQSYARPPQITFGRRAGGIRALSYETDGNDNVVGVDVTVGRKGGTLDVFVNEP